MASTVRSRLLTLALAASLVVPASLALTVVDTARAVATDAPPRSPAPAAPAPLTAADVAAATDRETADVVFSDRPQFSPATTATVTGTLRVYDVNGAGPFAASSASSWVRFWRLDTGTGDYVWQADVDVFGAGGEFSVSGLAPGDYRV